MENVTPYLHEADRRHEPVFRAVKGLWCRELNDSQAASAVTQLFNTHVVHCLSIQHSDHDSSTCIHVPLRFLYEHTLSDFTAAAQSHRVCSAV